MRKCHDLGNSEYYTADRSSQLFFFFAKLLSWVHWSMVNIAMLFWYQNAASY